MEGKGARQRRPRWPIVAGVALCVLTLALCAVLQHAGYLTYLDSDKAAELILAQRQADTHSFVQMDWLYSTEVRIVQINLFYALAFFFTESFEVARIVGNTMGLMLAMGACVFLCRRLRLSWGRALAAAALLPITSSAVYANTVTVGGYYIFHMAFGFLAAGLWLSIGGRKKRALALTAVYALLCMLEGFLSVRYVLCFICPMAATAAAEWLLAPGQGRALRDHSMRFALATAAGVIACVMGFAASEIVIPRLFLSGVGAASSFAFNPLDGGALLDMLMTVLADFLKLLGWRGGVRLFSLSGIVNVSIAGVLVLGAMMTRRVYRALDAQDAAQRVQKRMMAYAGMALAVNLFCFLFISGTYLNRYLIPAVIFLIPTAAIVLRREKSARLRVAFTLMLCVQLGASSAVMMQETRAQEAEAKLRSADMMDAAAFLQDEGYTHGFGTFWNVRLLQERTQGDLTFTGVAPIKTEEGAVSPVSMDMIRWLEPDGYSDLDVCPGKTFLLLTREEETELAPWLEMTGAPQLYGNGTFAVYGFASSQQLACDALWGKMKLENAAYADGVYTLNAGGRMRVPTGWREAGSYALRLTCEDGPTAGGVVQVYTGRRFELLAEAPLAPGENELAFTLPQGDKYFMLLIRGGEADGLKIGNLALEKMGR